MKIRKFPNFILTRELEYQRRSQLVHPYQIFRLTPVQSVGTPDENEVKGKGEQLVTVVGILIFLSE